jgi:hypothetical protein
MRGVKKKVQGWCTKFINEAFKSLKFFIMGEFSLFQLSIQMISLITLILIILFNWLGYRYRQAQIRLSPGEEHGNLGAIEGAMLGLMTLMMAFSFGIVATRYETARQVVVDESKAIAVAVHKCDLYPDSVRNLLKSDFKNYLEARISYFNAGANEEEIEASLRQSTLFSERIWKRVLDLSQNLDNRVRSELMVPALDNLDDIVIASEAARITKLPPIILWMLLILTVISSFLVGFGNKGKRKNLVMVAGFALMTTAAFYLVIELDRPRQGLVNIDAAVKSILNLRNLFTPNQ